MLAAIYLRVSTDEQTTENQERELRAAADRIGHEIVAVYRDAGISPARHDRPADLRGPARQPCPSEQALPHLRDVGRSAQSSSRQRTAEGHGRACSRTCRRASGSGRGRSPGGRGSIKIKGSTPCKANFPCTSACDAERGPGVGAHANRRRCRTAAAGCTAENHRGHRRGIRTPTSTGSIRRRPLLAGDQSRC